MVIVLTVVLLLLTGCSFPDEPAVPNEKYDLPAIEIEMRDDDYRSFSKESQVNEWVGITLFSDGETQNCALKWHGDVSRRNWKPSIKIRTATGDYIYSSQYGDESFSRYRLTSYLFDKSGILTGNVAPVFATVNGREHGVYLYREPVDYNFFDNRNLHVISLYKLKAGAVFSFQNGQNVHHSFEKEYPDDSQNYSDLIDLIYTVDEVRITGNWSLLESKLDIENVLKYYAVSTLVGHWDGIQKNCFLWNDGESGLFRMVPWDMDRTFENGHSNLPVYKNGLFELLMTNPHYADRVRELQRELWEYEEMCTVLDNFVSEVFEATEEDPYFTALGYEPESCVAEIKRFLSDVDGSVKRLFLSTP